MLETHPPKHKEGRTIGTQTQARKRQNGSNGKAKSGSNEYVEDAGWGTAFYREDNEVPQPTYTGQGVLDDETLRAIHDAGGEFQIAIWPRRTKNGLRTLRIHIEPPYNGGTEPDELDDSMFDGNDEDDPGDELPF